MNKPLSFEEINLLIQKIRKEYTELGKINPKAYPILPFEERYAHALKHKANLMVFITEEISFLEKLKQKQEELKKKAEASKATTINRIIDDFEKTLEKYPRIFINADARNELNFFYGAIVEYTNNDLQLLQKIFKGTPEMSLFVDSIQQIEKLGFRINGKNSSRIQEHVILIISLKGAKSLIEKDTQLILKDTCISLKSITKYLYQCLDKKLIILNNKLVFKEEINPNLFKLYNGLEFGVAINKIIANSLNIIKDFRMDEIVRDLQ